MLAQSLAPLFLLNPTSNPLEHPISFTFNIFRIHLLFTPVSYDEDYHDRLLTGLSITQYDKCLKNENSSPVPECSGSQCCPQTSSNTNQQHLGTWHKCKFSGPQPKSEAESGTQKSFRPSLPRGSDAWWSLRVHWSTVIVADNLVR